MSTDSAGNKTQFIGNVYVNTCRLIESNPTNTELYADLKADIVLNFSKDIVEGINYNLIALEDESGNKLSLNKIIDGNKLIIKHPDLALGSNYKLYLQPGSLNSVDNIPLTENLITSFRTYIIPLDVDGSGAIDLTDLSSLDSNYNNTQESATWSNILDINGDGIIDIYDIVIIASQIR